MTLKPKVVKKIWKLKEAGCPIREIAKELHIAKSTVQRYLSRDKEEHGEEGQKLKVLHEQLWRFQMQEEIKKLKVQVMQDPIDRLFSNKDKLERLGIVNSPKTSAAELEYQDKLDTLLRGVANRTKHSEERAKKVIEIFTPFIKECMHKAVAKNREMQQTRNKKEYKQTIG